MISILVAYCAVIGAVWAQKPDAIPEWMTIFLPIPVLAAIGWHSQMNSLVFAHNQSISVIEEMLFKFTPNLTDEQGLWVGANCGRLVTDVPILLAHRRIGMAAASLTAYGAIAAMALALTVASVWIPIADNYNVRIAIAMGVLYLFIVILLGISYVSTFGINKDVLDSWAQKASDDDLI